MEEDFITQPFLKLYAKLKGNTNAIKKPHADKSGTRDFEKKIWGVRVDVPKKRNNTKANITLDEDFIKQPILKLYAKLKGNVNAIQQPHAAGRGTRDFEKGYVLLRVDVP